MLIVLYKINILNKKSIPMIKRKARFEWYEINPTYQITIKKVWDIYEGRIEGYLVFKNKNKQALLKECNSRCKEQVLLKKQKEW